jgi:hypothetical protein
MILGESLGPLHPVRQSRAAFFLACAEQLIPCVSDQLTERLLIPSAQRYVFAIANEICALISYSQISRPSRSS